MDYDIPAEPSDSWGEFGDNDVGDNDVEPAGDVPNRFIGDWSEIVVLHPGYATQAEANAAGPVDLAALVARAYARPDEFDAIDAVKAAGVAAAD